MVWFVSFDIVAVVVVFIALAAYVGLDMAATYCATFLVDSCKWIIAHPAASITIWLVSILLISLIACCLFEKAFARVISFFANFIMLLPFGITNFVDIIPFISKTAKGPISLCLTWLLNFGLILIVSVIVILFANFMLAGPATEYTKASIVFAFLLLIVAILFVVGNVYFIHKYSFYSNWSTWISHINMYGFNLGA